MLKYLQYLVLLGTTAYQFFGRRKEKQQIPPGELIDMGKYCLHLYKKGAGETTVIIDHSLGGLDGYFLIDALSELTQVCIYDRAGYGWSDRSFLPRNSDNITLELELLLSKAEIHPPYILVGNSFGSYNMRLYAHKHPEKVAGLIFTDGLHESAMLNMSFSIIIFQTLIFAGFLFSILGSFFGIVRIASKVGIFEIIKPELNKFDQKIRQRVKRSFYQPKHWITMAQELWHLGESGEYLKAANDLEGIPIINIKAETFFKKSLWTRLIPLKTINKLRDKIHEDLSLLSTNYSQLNASRSSHFVWLDQPELIASAVQNLLHASK